MPMFVNTSHLANAFSAAWWQARFRLRACMKMS